MTHPSHVVVDTRDGFTISKDSAGCTLTLDTARKAADAYNAECKPEHRTYAVASLTILPAYAANVACREGECVMWNRVHSGAHIRGDGSECITVTPSPAMRAAVSRAAGLSDAG